MKNKAKLLIGSIIIAVLVMYNINFIIDKELTEILFNGSIEAMASGESGEVIGTKYQLVVGCDGESFLHYKLHCHRGNYPTCIEECPQHYPCPAYVYP